MIHTPIRFITVGNLKEPYLREAAAEYKKRLSGMCRVEEIELKEHKLPDDPSETEIRNALSQEAKAILEAVPSRAYLIALCVEGKQYDSPELSALLEKAGQDFLTENKKCATITTRNSMVALFRSKM
jgi:23S rRNA (pseudouridine1915-N3)-methyltransferase